jgi:fatty-acyl-CoA synthase
MEAIPQARTVPALLDELAARRPDRPALLGGGQVLDFAALRARAHALARDLLALGLRPGERLAILMGNRPEWLLLDFAAKLIGALPVGINTWSTAPELDYVLRHAGAAMLVTADRFLKADFLALLDALRPWPERLPALRRVVVLGADGRADTLPFARLDGAGAGMDAAEVDRLAARVRPEDPAILLYTSGSTSKPKGVLLAHRGLIENMWDIGARLHLDGADRVWLAVSLFWALGSVNALYAAFTHGAAVVLQEHFEPGAALRLIAGARCTALYGTPNMLGALLDHPEHDRHDLSCVRKCATIGTPEQMRRVIDELAPLACQIYGMTETYGNCAVTDAADPPELRATTVGAPLAGQRIRIVDPATGRVLGAGETGEVRVKGHVMAEYYRDPARTADAFDAEGWLHTGDLGFLGADGRLRFRGRIKEMVKSGGINIAPAEVEETLQAHPAVAQAYVVGVPDPKRDELLAAVIVPRAGAAIAAETLAAHCASRLSTYKIPRLWRVVAETELPLTVTGKLQKNRLAELFAED